MLKRRKCSNKYHKIFLFIFMSMFLTISFVVNAKPVVINFPVNDAHSVVRVMGLQLKELVSQNMGDEVIQINVTKLGEKDLFEEMRIGNAQMIAPKLSRFKRYSKRIQVFELPFVFYSTRSAEDFLDGVWGERLLTLLKRKEIYAYGYLHQGMRNITSNEKISEPSHLSKKSLGVFHSNTAKTYFKSLGAKVASLNQGEVDVAISSNRINATESDWGSIYEQGLYKKHKYVLESSHGYSGNVLVVSKEVLDQISPEVEMNLKKLIKESIRYGNDYIREQNARYRKLIVGNGNAVHELSASERYLWVTEARNLWSSFEGDIGAQLIDAAASHR